MRRIPSCGCFQPTAARARRLTAGDKDSDPVWSPNGKWIAFCAKRKDDDEAQIYLIAPDGGEARRVTSLSTGASALRWFPDSRRIAFVSRVWPDLKSDKAQAKRLKERKDDKVKVAHHRACRISVLGPLADRRTRAARVRRGRRDRARPRPPCRHGVIAATVGSRPTSTSTSAPTVANSPSPRISRRSRA